MQIIKLDGYNATVDNGKKLELGTFDSYGEEQLQIVKAQNWENLSVIATFNPPNKKPVQVVVDSVTGVIKVPKEATANLYGVGTIVFVGLADGVQRISADVEYIVRKHSNANGTEPAEPTPSVVEQILTEAQNANTNSAEAKKLATDAKDIAQSVRDDADSGKFNGKDGKDGAKGDKGDDGTTPQLKIGEDNLWNVSYDNGATWVSLGVKATGNAGKDGADGVTPHIGENGNWWLGNTDTGVSAKGPKGDPGPQGPAGEIPEDYPQIQEDVSKLKEDIGDIESKFEIETKAFSNECSIIRNNTPNNFIGNQITGIKQYFDFGENATLTKIKLNIKASNDDTVVLEIATLDDNIIVTAEKAVTTEYTDVVFDLEDIVIKEPVSVFVYTKGTNLLSYGSYGTPYDNPSFSYTFPDGTKKISFKIGTVIKNHVTSNNTQCLVLFFDYTSKIIKNISDSIAQNIDTTLLESGKAADAKVVGDKLSKLEEDTAVLQKRQNVLVGSETGNPASCNDAFAAPLCGLTVYGKSTQDGTPSPDNPVPIVSAGDGGSVVVKVSDGNGKEQTLTLQTPTGLNGIPVTSGGNYTDQNGQQWICDEVDLERGVKVQRVKSRRILSSEVKDTILGVNSCYIIEQNIARPANNRQIWHIMCTHLESNSWNRVVDNGVQGICVTADQSYIGIAIQGFKSVNEYKDFMDKNEVGIAYELATPIETPLTPAEIAAYKALTAYAPDTVVQASDGAGIKLDYQRDVNLVVKNLEDAIASMTTT